MLPANKNTKNIIKNAFLLEREKEYYFDVTRHSNFNLEMQMMKLGMVHRITVVYCTCFLFKIYIC